MAHTPAADDANLAALLANPQQAVSLFATLFDKASLSMQIFAADGTCVYANPAWSAIWGTPVELVRGYNVLRDPQAVQVGLAESLKRVFAGESIDIPPTFYDPRQLPGNPPGRARWCSAHASVVCDETGRMLWVMMTHEDMTAMIEKEMDLAEKEALYATVFEQSPMSIQIYEADGRIWRVNPACERLWNISAAVVSGYDIFQDRQLSKLGIMGDVERAFAGDQVFIDSQAYHVSQNADPEEPDRVFWLRTYFYPLRDREGAVTHVVVLHEDVSAQVAAERSGVEHADLFRAAFEQSNDAIFLHDQEGRVINTNQRAAQLFGLSATDLETFRISELHPPHTREYAATQVEKMMQQGHVRFEVPMLRWDGQEFPAEISGTIIDVGERKLVLGVVRDKSDDYEREQRIRLLASAVEHSPASLLILDTTQRVVFANNGAATLFGRSAADLTGSRQADVPGRWPAEITRPAAESVLDSDWEWHDETPAEVIDPDGQGTTSRILQRSIAPVFNGAGVVTNFICIDIDVTVAKKRKEKQEHVQRLESLGVLAGGIAHDFNNLLTAIIGHASLARMETGPLDPCVSHLGAIEETSQRAADLCQQMLAYSGKGRFVVQPIDLSDLVREMVRLIEVSIHKSVTVRYDLMADLPAIEADVAQMRQVIMNLVINASEAIGEKNGDVFIVTGTMEADAAYLQESYVQEEALAPGRYVFLEVSDTGCGMDEETRRRLFEPFFTTKFTGRGLGMSAILGIVRGHAGAVKIYSEPGRGAAFKVLFPATDMAPVPLGPSSDPDPDFKGTGTILVVDDEEAIRNLAIKILQRGGYDVVVAADGLEAIDQLRAHGDEITCVLLDMTMPRMSGEEAFSELRRIRPDLKVVLTSGHNEQTATQRFTGRDLAGFIQKPYLPQSLLAKLAEVIG